jgi:hypothetical protein
LYGALCLAAITWVLITSLTVEFIAVASCPSPAEPRRVPPW